MIAHVLWMLPVSYVCLVGVCKFFKVLFDLYFLVKGRYTDFKSVSSRLRHLIDLWLGYFPENRKIGVKSQESTGYHPSYLDPIPTPPPVLFL